jgi:hypothetical protein
VILLECEEFLAALVTCLCAVMFVCQVVPEVVPDSDRGFLSLGYVRSGLASIFHCPSPNRLENMSIFVLGIGVSCGRHGALKVV